MSAKVGRNTVNARGAERNVTLHSAGNEVAVPTDKTIPAVDTISRAVGLAVGGLAGGVMFV